jgi:Rod binding domain-containing protein
MNNNFNLQMIQNSSFYNKTAKMTTKAQDPAKAISQEFAADFFKIFLKEAMPPSENEMFGGGIAEKQYNEMLIDELATQMSQQPNSALVNQIYVDVQKRIGGSK